MATAIGTSWTLIGTSSRYYVGAAQGYLRLYAKINSQDPIAKTTNYSVLLNLVVDVGYFGNYQSTPWSVSADSISNSGDIGSGSHGSKDLGTATGNVSHDADGAKTISASGSLNLTAWGVTLKVSGSGDLPALDVAPPTVSFEVNQSNVNSIKITANSSIKCNSWDYSIDGGKSWTNFSTSDETSVSGTITGLTVNTTYPISVRARRTYNYIYGYSPSQNVKTLGIATGSDITAVIGDTINISWTRYVSSYVHTIRYEFGSKSGTIGTGLVDSVNWFIPMNLLYEMPTSSSKIGKYWIDTYDGNTLVGSNEYKLTLQTPDIAKPDFSIDLTDAGQASISGVFIKGFSKICATIISDNFSNLYGATITKVKLKVGNLPEKSINYDPNDLPFSIISDTLQQGNVGVNILVTVVDSRGNEKTVATTRFIYAFEKPGIKDISFRISEGQCVIDIYGVISRLTVDGRDYNEGTLSVYGRPISSSSRYIVTEEHSIISTDFYNANTGEFHVTITDDTPGAESITSESYEYSVQIEDLIYTGSLKVDEYSEQTGVVCISRYAGGKGVAFFGEAFEEGIGYYLEDSYYAKESLEKSEWDELYDLLGITVSDKTYKLLEVLKNAGGAPVGAINQFAGSTAPNNWLICNGQAVSRTAYAKLFSVIGTTYGAGDGSTTFNVPNLVNRFPVGAGDSYNVGGTGGEATHKLSVSEMPAHNHTTESSGSHIHTITNNPNCGFLYYAKGYQFNFASGGVPAACLPPYSADMDSAGSHTHTINDTGGSGEHNNMPPYLAINYIIKAK